MSFIIDVNLEKMPADKRAAIYIEIDRQYPDEPISMGEIYFMRKCGGFKHSYGSRYTFTNREKYTEWVLKWM